MKRLAIQLFGHMRTFEHTVTKFFKNVVDVNRVAGYQVDIFIHTWDEIDSTTISYRSDGSAEKIDLADTDIKKIKDIYHPTDLLITKQVPHEEFIIKEKFGAANRSIKGCANMAFSLYKGGALRRKYEEQHGVKYDWAIVTRPDVLFLLPLKLDEILDVYTKFNLLIPEKALFFANNPFRCNFGVEDPRWIAGSDLIWFASPNIADQATSLWENFDANIDVNDFYTMEVWWMGFFKKIGLEPLQINYPFRKNWLVLYKEMVPDIEEIISGINQDSATTMKNYEKKIYMFGFIPLLKIKKYCNRTRIYLFHFILILNIRRK